MDKDDTFHERDEFLESPTMSAVIEQVNKKLGFEGDESIAFSDLDLMYDMCRYQLAWTPEKRSFWCSVFDTEHLKVLEYSKDLKYWYLNAYGYPLNQKVACPLIKDLVRAFDNDTDVKGSFYFTHSEALMPFMTLLGLYKDNFILSHDLYGANEVTNRQFKSSLISPFATNVGFALHNCDGEKRVMMYVQEELTALPLCSNEQYCTWDEFKEVMKPLIECDFDAICENHRSSSGALTFSHSLAALVIFTAFFINL